MANLLTFSRLLLLFIVIFIIYFGSSWLQLFNLLLLILMFVTDGLDGYIARKRNETSLFGALFDVAADRIVELSLWVVFAHIGMLPVWIPLLYIVRGIIIDTIRASTAQVDHQTPFAAMQTSIAKFIVAGRFMRVFYAVLKAVTFSVLILMVPLHQLVPDFWQQYGPNIKSLSLVLAFSCTMLCIARGLPVITQFFRTQLEAHDK